MYYKYKGQPGENGKTGINGYHGNKGDLGEIGCNGEKGYEGIPGITGNRGDEGPQGIMGLYGLKGIKGYIGCKGKIGDKSFKGSMGNIGCKGKNGEIGESISLIGEKGETGIIGKNGSNGLNGALFYIDTIINDGIVIIESEKISISRCDIFKYNLFNWLNNFKKGDKIKMYDYDLKINFIEFYIENVQIDFNKFIFTIRLLKHQNFENICDKKVLITHIPSCTIIVKNNCISLTMGSTLNLNNTFPTHWLSPNGTDTNKIVIINDTPIPYILNSRNNLKLSKMVYCIKSNKLFKDQTLRICLYTITNDKCNIYKYDIKLNMNSKITINSINLDLNATKGKISILISDISKNKCLFHNHKLNISFGLIGKTF